MSLMYCDTTKIKVHLDKMMSFCLVYSMGHDLFARLDPCIFCGDFVYKVFYFHEGMKLGFDWYLQGFSLRDAIECVVAEYDEHLLFEVVLLVIVGYSSLVILRFCVAPITTMVIMFFIVIVVCEFRLSNVK